ncbi:hypothetical protein DE146DRAFT_679512 [Phaeosphaeria sp. MPI-PUGE-AT-0046c]|nr:hypothetical protein DE146DRAFT_679512 [Phaeosphaeria sp. MPI-PUGE-AT-0046c]
MPVDRQPPKKQLRTSRACDFCHKRSIKCKSSTDQPTKCQNCSDFDVLCTYERPMRRGRALPEHILGRPARPTRTLVSARSTRELAVSIPEKACIAVQLWGSTQHRPVSAWQTVRDQTKPNKEMPSEAWRAFAAASAGAISDLVHVYLQVAYPIFPLFHQPTLLRNMREQNYLLDRGCFASIMGACALASARQRDGALHTTQENLLHIGPITSETFYAAAVDSLPKDLTSARGFEFLRACALLCITSIQYGDIAAMQLYLGHYFTLVAINRFHDETCWPKNASNIEIEERRRLYWSVYTLDIYASIVWNGDVHSCSTNARVRYPTEVEDRYITTLGSPASVQPYTSWLRGWNFTTDLYLVLEQASNRLRARQSRLDDRFDVNAVFGISSTPSSTMLAYITARYNSLPANFKFFDPPTGKPERDIYGFQAANIQATLLLLRMVFLCTEDDPDKASDVQLKCNVAAELVAVFENIPTAYLCGISTPLIYHLAGIGSILGSVMENPLSETNYRQIRRMLLSIADLLARLERGLSRAADISKSLRSQVEQIDAYMRLQQRPIPVPAEPDQSPSLNISHCDSVASTIPKVSLEQRQPTGDDQDTFQGEIRDNNAQMSDTGIRSVVDAEFFVDQWTSDVQLPPELLDDWLWPFDLQPESWSSLGL